MKTGWRVSLRMLLFAFSILAGCNAIAQTKYDRVTRIAE